MRIQTGACIVAASLTAVLTTSALGGLISVPFFETDGSNTIEGVVTLVDITTGDAGGTVLTGSASNVTLVFQISLLQGTLSEFGVGAIDGATPVLSAGAGWIPNDPGLVDITSVGGTLDTPIFMFDGLEAPETSDLFFVSYDSIALDGSVDLNFMITDGVPTFTVSTTLVPAPGVLALLGLGLFVRRRRRS